MKRALLITVRSLKPFFWHDLYAVPLEEDVEVLRDYLLQLIGTHNLEQLWRVLKFLDRYAAFFVVVALLIPVQKGKGRKRTEEDKAGKNRALTGNPFTPKTLTRRFLFIFNSEPCGRRYKAGEETRKGSV